MTSDSGDYIGGGQNYYYGPGVGTYNPAAGDQNSDGKVDYVRFNFVGGGQDWSINFSSRLTGRNIEPGFYDNAVRYPFEDGNHPGLSISGNGRGCNTLSGNYTVHEAEFDYTASPTIIKKFTATFEQHCEGGSTALYGTIYYNYTPSGQTYSISGKLTDNFGMPVANAAVGLFGSQTKNTITDADGNYSFQSLLSKGNFKIIPVATNYLSNPTSSLFRRLSDNQTADFTIISLYGISGHILNDSGSPLTGVTVKLTGSQTSTVTTDAEGGYSFAGLRADGNYIVTPSRSFYAFNPSSKTYNTLAGNQVSDFVGTIAKYSISGRILDNFGAGISGIRVDLDGANKTLVTDGNGIYSFTDVSAGSNYQVRPVSAAYNFSPSIQYFYTIDHNYSNILFTASLSSIYSINGFVLDSAGNPLGNAAVTLSGAIPGNRTSDAAGFYNFGSLPAGSSYTITVQKTGYTFNTSSKTVSSLNANIYVNFVGVSQSAPRTSKLFDFDGDGKADISVFRPSNGTWYLQQSQNGFTGAQFGVSTDKLVPADYDGDGKTDLAVYRNGTWYLQRSSAGFTGIAFGDANDIPQPADFDGDGKADLAVYRPSNGTWYVYNLATNQFTAAQFGASTDTPVVGDYNGDGKADYAVFRPSNGYWYIARATGIPAQNFDSVQFGDVNDKTVAADYDGDGKTDIAVYRPSNGTWYLNRSTAGFTGVQFGISTDLPAPADYDGDGKADVAVFRSGTWYVNRSAAGFTGVQFGAATDKPVPNAFVP